MSAYHVKKKEDLCSLESKGNEKWPSKRGKELQSSRLKMDALKTNVLKVVNVCIY